MSWLAGRTSRNRAWIAVVKGLTELLIGKFTRAIVVEVDVYEPLWTVFEGASNANKWTLRQEISLNERASFIFPLDESSAPGPLYNPRLRPEDAKLTFDDYAHMCNRHQSVAA